MLDLQSISKKYYELVYFDGTHLHLKKPTQKLFRELIDITNLENEEVDKMFDVIYGVITEALNNNIDDRTFSSDEVRESFDIETAFLFIQDYLADITSVLGE